MAPLNAASFSPLVNVYELSDSINWETYFVENPSGLLDVEIGFGLGETLIRMAQSEPQRNFVGIEQNWERICKTLRQIEILGEKKSESHLNNIRILKVDARLAFERFFKAQSIDRILSLFPCPWPKAKHVKHRLFFQKFFRLLNNRLKSNGQIKIVTDHGLFFEWILEEVKGTGFAVQTQSVTSQYDTKFERKWVGSGKSRFFELQAIKKDHWDIPVVENVEMKSYLVDNFNPADFKFDPVTTKDCSVILKEMIYDSLKKKALLHFVVQEDYLTQHFWAMIVKQGDRWRICKSDGQTVFQTPGTALALELLCEKLKHTVR